MSILTTAISRSNPILIVYLLFTASLLTAQPTDDPNLIDVGTFDQLNAIRFDFDGNGVVDDDANATAYSDAFGTPSCAPSCAGFELTTDLDLQPHLADVGETWEPIGDVDNSFNAIFNGNGHALSNLEINTSASFVGMFGRVAGSSVVRNLGLVDVDVTSTTRSNSFSTGGLAGVNSGLIIGCYVTGTVTGRGRVGGLVGENNDRVIASYSQAEVRGEMVAQRADLGGLVGVSDSGAKITACYATGNVTGDVPSGGGITIFNQGGLVGRNENTITACYSTGTVSGSGGKGGLVGFNRGTITDSYFDHEFGGLVDADGSEADANVDTNPLAQATSALQSLMSYTDLYAAWNLDLDGDSDNNGTADDPLDPGLEVGNAPGEPEADSPWDFGTGSEYPALRIDFNLDGIASAYEFGGQGRPAPPLPNTRNLSLIDVGTFDQLDAIRYDLDGNGVVDDDANATAYSDAFGTPSCAPSCAGYELTTDLDLQPHLADVSETWEPIGDLDNSFNAIFNGNGHIISNLSIEIDADDVGLFGYVGAFGSSNAVIRNVGLEDVDVTNTQGSSDARAGGLVSENFEGLIIGCYVTGTVTGAGIVGGLVGVNSGSIIASYSQADVVGDDAVNFAQLGGLVGLDQELITACYATGDVTSTSTNRFDRGGLVGYSDGSTTTACYSTGTVTTSGTGSKGGLVGGSESTITNSYFDSSTAGLTDAIGDNSGTATNVSGQTTSELQSPTDYTDPFDNWNLDIDNGRNPGLEDGTTDGDDTPDSPWDFGGDLNYPRLRIDFDLDGDVEVFGPQPAVMNATPPAAPANLTATAASSTQINLEWQAPDDGGSAITGYVLQFNTDGGSSFTDIELTGTATTYQHTGLSAATAYHYQVAATNNVGTGGYSSVASATTNDVPATEPGMPAGLTATAASDTQINLEWTAPDDGGSAITGYVLQFNTDGGSSFTDIELTGTVTTYQHTGLSAATAYHYQVAATNNVGTGGYSSVASATTNDVPATATEPGMPAGLTATAASDTQINLEWTAPDDGGSAITGYVLQFNTDGGSSFTDIELTGTATTYQHTGLSAATAYHYQVAATNNVGTGGYSSVASATTNDVPATATEPGMPTGLMATPGDAGVTLSWTAPSDGGDPITSYEIRQATASADLAAATPTSVAVGDITINGSGASHVVSGLADGIYYFQVAATNSVGTGAYSSAVSATISTTNDILSVPGVVGSVRVYPNPASQEVRLTNLPAAAHIYRVYSLAGKVALVGAAPAHSSAAIDVSGLARGQYVLVLQAEGGSETLRARLAVK